MINLFVMYLKIINFIKNKKLWVIINNGYKIIYWKNHFISKKQQN